MKIKDILKKFSGKTILVIGDLMVDHYLYGSVERQSPEAPVPVLLAKQDEYRLGGAANVANNLKKLGAGVLLVSMVGEDPKGEKLVEMLEVEGIDVTGIVRTKDYPTTEKLRVIDNHNKQLIRLDFERTDDISGILEDEMISRYDQLSKDADGVIISDYAKGVMSPRLIKYVIERCNAVNMPVFVDPKPKHKDAYKGAYLMTPNENESAEMGEVDVITDENCDEVGKRLQEELSTNVVMTRGKKGMHVFYKDDGVFDVPTKAEEVFDVTGAGDTVICANALACTAGANITEACEVANAAAHSVIGKFGTETTTQDDILEIL